MDPRNTPHPLTAHAALVDPDSLREVMTRRAAEDKAEQISRFGLMLAFCLPVALWLASRH